MPSALPARSASREHAERWNPNLNGSAGPPTRSSAPLSAAGGQVLKQLAISGRGFGLISELLVDGVENLLSVVNLNFSEIVLDAFSQSDLVHAYTLAWAIAAFNSGVEPWGRCARKEACKSGSFSTGARPPTNFAAQKYRSGGKLAMGAVAHSRCGRRSIRSRIFPGTAITRCDSRNGGCHGETRKL
jgi:hypothetical protein